MKIKNLIILFIKFLWIIRFKLKYSKSPKFIITAFEHRKLIHYVKKPGLIIDIGFNKGQFSSLALEYWPNVFLLAFDPHPYASKKSSANLSKSYPDFFEFRNIGISSQNLKIKELNLAKKSDNSSFSEPTNFNNKLYGLTKIKEKSFCKISKIKDEIDFKEYNKNWFLKIDVQGSELDVLKSISKEQYLKIKWIYVEVTDYFLYKNQCFSLDIIEFLKSKGFKLLKSFNNNFLNNKLLYADFLFCKDFENE